VVLQELLRIGRRAIVSFPNFGYWRIRLQVVLGGRMPLTQTLGYPWYETPNIHLCTIRDFLDLCRVADAKVERAVALNAHGRRLGFNAPLWLLNLIGEQAIFLLQRGSGHG
jgi:methionine biosynthesis protein MetW